jgi:hypothetical protein
MESITSARARLVLGATAVLAALTLSAGPVMADTELGHTGKVGDHYLNDVSGYTGVICHYDEDNTHLTSFEVRQPNIWARNRTTHRDSQKVGWRILIKRQMYGSSAWKTFFKSSIKKATAYDDQSAYFPIRTLTPQMPHEPIGEPSHWMAVIKMYWFAADGSVAGTARHRVDVYKLDNGSSTTEAPYCNSLFQV